MVYLNASRVSILWIEVCPREFEPTDLSYCDCPRQSTFVSNVKALTILANVSQVDTHQMKYCRRCLDSACIVALNNKIDPHYVADKP